MKLNYLTSVIILLLLTTHPVPAQISYNVKNFTGDNGLPQNSIKSISQDANGFIWLGTEDGLVRFDGHKFYTFSRSNLDIKDNRVYFVERLERDPSFLATGRNKSITVYFFSGDFVKIQSGTVSRDSASRHDYEKKIRKITKDPKQFLETQGIPTPYYFAFGEQFQDFRIKAGNDNGTFYLCGNKSIRFYQNYLKQYETAFPARDVFNFFSLSDKLYYFDPKTKSISIIGRQGYKTLVLSGDIVLDSSFINAKSDVEFYWNDVSDQAFIYMHKSLYLLKQQPDGSLTTRKIVAGFDLAENSIKRIHYDPLSSRVFLGSITKGLFVVTPHQFHTLTSNISKDQNIFYGQIPYSTNTVLTPDGHEIGFDPRTGKYTDQLLPSVRKQNYFDQRIIVRDKDSTIWTKSAWKLVHLDKTGTSVLHQWMFRKRVNAIHQATDGTIYTGLTNGEFYKIGIRGSVIRPDLLGKCPAPREITQINSIGNDTLLLGTNAGMYLFRMSARSLYLVNSLKNTPITSIHPSDNKIWITALEKGLLLMNSKLQVIYFPLDPNNFLASPHCVFSDSLGFLWIPTNKGLFQFAEKDLLAYAKLKTINDRVEGQPSVPSPFYLYHTMEEGFNTNEFNGSCHPCAVKLNNGFVSLPSLNGLVWFKPENIHKHHSEKSIILDRVTIKQGTLKLKGDTLLLPVLPENINLMFATTNTDNIYNTNVSFMLLKGNAEQGKNSWTPINNQDFTIRYSSLSSGHYNLLIRKLDGFGPNNYSVKKIHIIVPPAWYESVWAFLAYFFIVCFSIYLIVMYRTKSIQKENRRLQLLVNDQTRDLRVTMLELQQSKHEMSDQIHLLSRLVASISHDIHSPLNYITYSSSRIEQLVQEGKLDDVTKLGTMISSLSKRMSLMLHELLDYIKIQVYNNKMHFTDLNLSALIQDKIEIFKDVIQTNHSSIDNRVENDITVFSDHQLLSIIIHNLIDNAAKYTKKGDISIYMKKRGDGKSELIISNTGSQLPEEVISMINHSGLQNESSAANQRTSGIGLLIVKEIAGLIDVNIHVTQTDKTCFHLVFDN